MKVEIKNRSLEQVIDLLFNLSLKGKQSRQRTKFLKVLNKQIKEVDEGRVELAKEHAKKDENGEPIVKDGSYDLNDEGMKAFRKDLNELYNESIIFEGANNEDMLKTVRTVIEECDKSFSGQEATVYNYLYDQFEQGEDDNHDVED